MPRALYYPHTDIASPVVLKNALILWDKIETIVPYANWRRRGRTGFRSQPPSRKDRENKLLREAHELVVEPRVPTHQERSAAHISVKELVETGAASSLILRSPRGWQRPEYLIYPQKFLEQTWHLLEGQGLARWEALESDYGVPAALGLLMMSLLAEACAGTQLQKVTDRTEAYSWIEQYRAKVVGSPYVTGLDVSQVGPDIDRLVTITCEVLDVRRVSLKRLLDFRKRELKSSGSDYVAMRRNYAAVVQRYVSRIGKEAKTRRDVDEIENQFKSEVQQDLADLKSELKVASWKTLFSEKVAVSAAILAGSLAAPVAGLTSLATHLGGIGIIPLVKSGIEYRESRKKALRAHPISWLYLTNQGQITLY